MTKKKKIKRCECGSPKVKMQDASKWGFRASRSRLVECVVSARAEAKGHKGRGTTRQWQSWGPTEAPSEQVAAPTPPLPIPTDAPRTSTRRATPQRITWGAQAGCFSTLNYNSLIHHFKPNFLNHAPRPTTRQLPTREFKHNMFRYN